MFGGYFNFLEREASKYKTVLNEEQKQLSKKYVDPSLKNLISFFRETRAELDNKMRMEKKLLLKQELEEPLRIGRTITRYPQGHCDLIADYCFLAFKKTRAFKRLKDKNVEAKIIYGVVDDSYFQNALQIGDYYFDVAHDASSGTNKRFDLHKLEDVDFKASESLEFDASIEGKYHKFRVIPNFYLPKLSLFYSFFTVDFKKSTVYLKPNSSLLLHEDIKSSHKMSNEFFTRGDYSSRRLPKRAEQKLEGIIERLKDSFPFELRLEKNNGMANFFSELNDGLKGSFKEREEIYFNMNFRAAEIYGALRNLVGMKEKLAFKF